MQGRKGHFPEAEKDPVIQIANVLSVQGQVEPLVKNVLTLKGCLPIVGAQVLVNNTEEDLLAKWRTFVQEADPDIITGYNIANFDLPYLLKRADTLAKRSAKLKVGGWLADWLDGRVGSLSLAWLGLVWVGFWSAPTPRDDTDPPPLSLCVSACTGFQGAGPPEAHPGHHEGHHLPELRCV